MARFSPTRRVQTTVPTVFDALNEVIDRGAHVVEDRRRRSIEDEELGRRRAHDERIQEGHETDLYRQGFRRGEQPQEAVPEERDIFAGSRIGQQERTPARNPIFEGQRPGMASDATAGLDDALGAVAAQGARRPQMVAPPGAFVEGMGFARQAIFDTDLMPAGDEFVESTRGRQASPRMEPARGTERVTDELYRDFRPELAAQEDERRSERERRQRLETVLGALQGGGRLPPELQAEGMELGVPTSQLFREEDEFGEPVITAAGRKFPDNPIGEQAALDWLAATRAATARGASGSQDRITGEVTRRSFAMSAANAVRRVQEEFNSMTPQQRARLRDQGFDLQSRIHAVIKVYGFNNMQELQEETRELRLRGVDGFGVDERPAGGMMPDPGGDIDFGDDGMVTITDDDIDAILEANPDASIEEIEAILLRGGM